MKKVMFGKTGVQVSQLCLGTMYFGSTIDKATSFSILDQYAQAGGMFLDTANKYASWVPGRVGGESESLLGQWMKERNNRRHLFVASKVGLPMPGVEKGLRADQVVEECEKTLTRLGTDVIDLYYAHADDLETPLEETLRAFDSLIQQGKVRFWATSNYTAWRLKDALGICKQKNWVPFCCTQMKYSCLQPRPGVPQEFVLQMPASDEILDFCSDHQLPLLAYSPLLGGIYGRDDKPLPKAYASEDNQMRIQTIRNLAEQLHADPNQIALARLLQHQSPIMIPVVGVSSVEQLRNNIKSCEIHLTEQQISSIEKVNPKGVSE